MKENITLLFNILQQKKLHKKIDKMNKSMACHGRLQHFSFAERTMQLVGAKLKAKSQSSAPSPNNFQGKKNKRVENEDFAERYFGGSLLP